MPTDRNNVPETSISAANAADKRSVARVAAIPMLGLGAACCATIELVNRAAPEFAAVPAIAGSVLGLAGLLLLLKSQIARARSETARKRRCLRIAPYLPITAGGTSACEALNAVLAPAGDATCEPPRRCDLVSAQAVARRAPRRRKAPAGAPVTPFLHGAESEDGCRIGGAPATLYAAIRLGGEWAEDIDLSPRASARLEADPFMQRLGRMS